MAKTVSGPPLFFLIQIHVSLESDIIPLGHTISLEMKLQIRKCEGGDSGMPEPSGALPLIGHLHLLRGKDLVFKKFAAISDKLGPIFSLKIGAYRLVVVSDPETVRDCFATNDVVLATRPNISIGRYVGYNNAILALAPYGDYWRELRKITTIYLFSNHRIEMLGHIRLNEVNVFIKHLYTTTVDRGSSLVRMDTLLEFMTFNIILRTVAGKRIEYGEMGCEEWRYKKAIQQTEYLWGVFMVGDAIPWLEWMDFAKVSLMKKTAKELDGVISKWLEEHLEKRLRNGNDEESLDQEKTIMDLLLDVLPEDVLMSGHTRDIIVKSTALILTLTGSDSAYITLIWTVSLLLNNPSVLKAAQDEIDVIVGKGRWVEESDIRNLKFLQAIVKETHRLYPPAPLTGIREASEDCYVGGYRVTKGTRLLVNIWKLHRDPKIWPEPETFRPERFMEEKPKCEQSGYGYMPFGLGRRSCPGMNLGLRVVYLVLARLLQGFEVRRDSVEPLGMAEGPGLALTKVEPVEISVMPRLEPELYRLT
ncbi:PREDICTED: cytochrome P450 82G1-like isoform X4 [Tarenaya hassleriana]|uniref:cytochrome P450 82G1-like isoform X4 n=1 Tax=Tarenaya hassleriana TaxID=28532 RepID=UPI00053C5917|nr:PREDICTED: cytochrome P450 82G1-like isoform X4 [Tarenaya hassleriana]